MENNGTEILRQPLFKTPYYQGPFDPNREGGYNTMNEVSLFGAVWRSKRDNNTTAPAVWDGGEIITPNTTDWDQVSGDYEAWLLNKDKPATTGTTGDYPYNGMGRVKLKKNMVNTAGEGEPEVLVNLLTQDMFYKDGPNNTRVPNTNTVFEVPYEFELAEDITLPDNSVLNFVGGSIDCSIYTISGNKMPTNVVYNPEQFGAGLSSDDTKAIQSCVNLAKNVRMDGTYNVYANTDNYENGSVVVPSNTDIEMNGTISYLTTTLDTYSIFSLDEVSNVKIHGNGKYIGDKLIHTATGGEWGMAISIINSNYIDINGGEYYNFWGDGIYIGYAKGASHHIAINNVYVHDYRRQGISVCGGHHISISNVKIEKQDSASYGSSQSSIDIEVHVATNLISDIVVENSEVEASIFVQHNSLTDTFHRIYLRNILIKNNVVVHDLNGDCVIENISSLIGTLSLRANNTISGNTPVVRNCKFPACLCSIGAIFYNCTFNNLKTEVSANPTDNAKFYNCEIITSGSGTIIVSTMTYEMYDTNIKLGSYVNSQEFFNLILVRCLIDFYDGAFGRFEARDCEIICRQQGTDNYIFYNDNLKMYHCLIRILGEKTYILYRLNRQVGGVYNPLINEGSVVISDVARTKTYGSDAQLYDAGTVYITNHAV